jgi:hypothetical protein
MSKKEYFLYRPWKGLMQLQTPKISKRRSDVESNQIAFDERRRLLFSSTRTPDTPRHTPRTVTMMAVIEFFVDQWYPWWCYLFVAWFNFMARYTCRYPQFTQKHLLFRHNMNAWEVQEDNPQAPSPSQSPIAESLSSHLEVPPMMICAGDWLERAV